MIALVQYSSCPDLSKRQSEYSAHAHDLETGLVVKIPIHESHVEWGARHQPLKITTH